MTDPLTLTTALAWAWDKYGEKIINKAFGEAKKEWENFRWQQAGEKYRLRVRELYGRIQILGMMQPVPLEGVFTDVKVFRKPTAALRYSLKDLREMKVPWEDITERDGERQPGIELVQSGENLFILGKPGAGKTTFLKYIALQAAQGKINKVPIFVDLKSWAAEELPLIDYLAQDLSKKAGLNTLHTALSRLPLPAASAADWGALAADLKDIMRQERDFRTWNLKKEQVERLETYLEANRLLAACLKRAAVSNRQAIEDRILLPPP